MDFRLSPAHYVNGTLRTEQLPEIALHALEQGIESPSLIILAGIFPAETERILFYFHAALRELNLGLPQKRYAALLVAKEILEEILLGKRPVFEGVQKLLDDALDHYPFFEETRKYRFDSIGFAEPYGLFCSLDDLPFHRGFFRRKIPIEESVRKIEAELLSSLKAWQPRLQKELMESCQVY